MYQDTMTSNRMQNMMGQINDARGNLSARVNQFGPVNWLRNHPTAVRVGTAGLAAGLIGMLATRTVSDWRFKLAFGVWKLARKF